MTKVQDIKENLDKRLKRIEGQVKGIRRMVEEGKQCQDILTQVAAARSALKNGGQPDSPPLRGRMFVRFYISEGQEDQDGRVA